MKILYVSPLNENTDGAHYFNSARKLLHGFMRNGHAVLTFSDRDIARTSNIFRNRKLGIKPANLRFLNTIRNFRPDFICLGHADMIHNETIEEARSILGGAPVAYYNIDPLCLPAPPLRPI